MRIDGEARWREKKGPARMVRAGRDAGRKVISKYAKSADGATEIASSRAKKRNILCLLGGSRQDVASIRGEATVFRGFCPVAPTIRCIKSPCGGWLPGSRQNQNRPEPWPIGRAASKIGIPDRSRAAQRVIRMAT